MNQLSVYVLGCKLLDILENIHKAGYVHNDLSLDKIVHGLNQKLRTKDDQVTNCFEDVSLHITDFTYARPYIDFKTGKHLKQDKVNVPLNINNDF